MQNLQQQHRAALQIAERRAFLDAVSDGTQVSEIGELLQRYPALGNITLAELSTHVAAPGSRAEPAEKRAPRADAKVATTSRKVATRTAAGREALDAAVLEVLLKLGPDGRGSKDHIVAAIPGVSGQQIGESIKRLKVAGKVKQEGKTSGARYFAVFGKKATAKS